MTEPGGGRSRRSASRSQQSLRNQDGSSSVVLSFLTVGGAVCPTIPEFPGLHIHNPIEVDVSASRCKEARSDVSFGDT